MSYSAFRTVDVVSHQWTMMVDHLKTRERLSRDIAEFHRLVEPSLQRTGGRPGRRRLYSFRDLIALRVVKSLLDNGMSIQRVRRAWDYLRRTADMDTHLSEIRLVTDGESIFAVALDEDEVLNALRQGQLAFFVAINDITQSVEEDVTRFELDRERFLEMLRRVEDDVLSEVDEAGG